MTAFVPSFERHPFLRSADKLKYIAGCEIGAGTFLVDMVPEQTVKILRQIADEYL